MKKYFQLLVEGLVLGMRNPKGDKEPEILAPGIMPVGRFIIHPKTNKIMLTDPAFPDAFHDSIALNYGFDNVNDAQSKGWVRGSYIKPNRIGGNGLLELEGYHGHEDLRNLLSRLSDVIPNNVDFMVDHYDREKGETDSKKFTGTEALNQYTQGGRINPIVAPTSTSTRTDYGVEKELRKTIPESQRTFESFTFSKLRTQLNEEHKDLIDEMHGHQTHSLRVESWQEYNAKVGETNTSLFEPGNTKFNMKAFLKKLRKKNGVRVNLLGEN